jgi:D-glycero-D-manno-heptose 1,7-bisphosphate phosphatase
MVMNRAVFLDRDGTINVEREFLYLPEDFEFIPGAPQAIRLLNEAGFRVIVVTNQSGIARGFYDEAAVNRLHRHMDAQLAPFGARIDAYYLCPHHPEHGIGALRTTCECRKPMDGMLRRGAAEFALDLAASFIIGDKSADVEAGLKAGCQPLLVRTGFGAVESARLPGRIPVCADLLEAVRVILSGAMRSMEG